MSSGGETATSEIASGVVGSVMLRNLAACVDKLCGCEEPSRNACCCPERTWGNRSIGAWFFSAFQIEVIGWANVLV